MNCCITDLYDKEVINVQNGCRIGFVCDAEIDTCSARVAALVVFGKRRAFGMFGKPERFRICWEEILIIGDDSILVRSEREFAPLTPPGHFLEKFWG